LNSSFFQVVQQLLLVFPAYKAPSLLYLSIRIQVMKQQQHYNNNKSPKASAQLLRVMLEKGYHEFAQSARALNAAL